MKAKSKQIALILAQEHQIDVSKYDESFLSKSILNRMESIECKTAEEYIDFIALNKKEGQQLSDSLRNNYSTFFRNPLTFSVLERIVLPLLKQKKKGEKKKEIRIWSAACAAGQEAYSIAMLLEEGKNEEGEKLNYRIFATDQCKAQLVEAQKGQFAEADLNNLSLKRAKQWFKKNGENYTINQELKKNIDFSEFDLFSEQFSSPPASIFGNFDLVICANLLFYYRPEYRNIILKKVGSCLTNDGYLITGEAEREIINNAGYKELVSQSAVFKKREQ